MPTPSFPVVDSTTSKPLPNCSRPIKYGDKIPVLKQEFDSGFQQRRKKGSNKQTFEFSYLVLNATEYKTIRDFFLARGGSTESFNWTDPTTKTTYLVHFDMDILVGDYRGHNSNGPLYELSIKLEQVL